MSAYAVNSDHIRELAIFAVSGPHNDPHVNSNYLRGNFGDLQYVGIEKDKEKLAGLYADILMAENIRSVNYRYSDNGSIPENKPFEFRAFTLGEIVYPCVTDPVHILKMCNSLEYQSCETEDYYKTKAYRLLMAIKEAAIRVLPGYEDAPWEFSRPADHKPAEVIDIMSLRD